jgi:hypothetical protein
MTANQIELTLEHELLSRFSKTSPDSLTCSLGDTSNLIKNLIIKYLNNESKWNNEYQVSEIVLDQYTQTHELVLKLGGAVKIEKDSEKLMTPFNLFMTLDRENLCFHSYNLLFGEKKGENSIFATPQNEETSSNSAKIQWKYNWIKNFK